jgi:hypothetical protein
MAGAAAGAAAASKLAKAGKVAGAVRGGRPGGGRWGVRLSVLLLVAVGLPVLVFVGCAALVGVASSAEGMVAGTGCGWTVPGDGPISSPFGLRRPPVAGASADHKGVDLDNGGYGTPILAAFDGVVVEATPGNWVLKIDHGDGLYTRYLHMADAAKYVKVGDTVRSGQQIAENGSSGPSTGPHLHFEVLPDNTPVDPVPFFEALGLHLGSDPRGTSQPCDATNEATDGSPKDIARGMMVSFGWTDTAQWTALEQLWTKESSWDATAVNPSSGACGIPQALPCAKMASEGADYRTNATTQIRWGLKYIQARYGSPSQAWAFWTSHNWY